MVLDVLRVPVHPPRETKHQPKCYVLCLIVPSSFFDLNPFFCLPIPKLHYAPLLPALSNTTVFIYRKPLPWLQQITHNPTVLGSVLHQQHVGFGYSFCCIVTCVTTRFLRNIPLRFPPSFCDSLRQLISSPSSPPCPASHLAFSIPFSGLHSCPTTRLPLGSPDLSASRQCNLTR